MKITVTDNAGIVMYEGTVEGATIECASSDTAEPKPGRPNRPDRPGQLPTPPPTATPQKK